MYNMLSVPVMLHFMACMASLASKTLFPLVDGCGQKCGGEKGSGVSGPYSVTTWNAIIGRVTQ